MSMSLSPEAQSLIDAAVSAAKAAPDDKMSAAIERSVEHSVGCLGLTNPQETSRMTGPLIEIAQLYVRQKLGQGR